MADLVLADVTKTFGHVVAVDRFSLRVSDGELLTLLGSSGSGKTTLLRLIGGYTDLSAGAIHVGERRIDLLPAEKRNIGMVFQQYALFPHMTVSANVAFGLQRRRVPPPEVATRVAEALLLVRLGDLGHRFPRELSGGQQQRVALARALVIRPSLLLLDEPMSNLDAKLRQEVRRELVELQRSLGLTTVLVTHDQEDALAVSDRIAVVEHGRLQQVGRPERIYDRPANRFVADFVGRITMWPARKVGMTSDGFAEYEGAGLRVTAPPGPESALVGVRPNAVTVGNTDDGTRVNAFGARIDARTFQGETDELVVTLADSIRLLVRVPAGSRVTAAPGATITVSWPPERTIVVPAD
jgi:ABC-type Fe3+/spermidine/putrescine transport system ATPase subunit